MPRQFYGMNYLSKLVSNFQESRLYDCPEVKYNVINDVRTVALEQKSTMELGLNATELSRYLKILANSRKCALDGFALSVGEKLVVSGYRFPFSEQIPRITNSTCKTIVAIAVMFAVHEKRLKEEDLVISFFPEYDSLLTPKYVRQITIKHLLMMTSCTKCNETISVVNENWVKTFLSSECHAEPGSHFMYNSMNTYMLCAVLTKVTGLSVTQYLKTRLFEPLGINHIKWELCPMGIEKGGWGLHISLEQLLKIGIFIANNGSFNHQRLIPAVWIKKMKETTITQDTDAFATGYGYQLWKLPKGCYMLSGMYGQHVIIDEQQKLVVAMNAHCYHLFPDSPLVRHTVRFYSNPDLFHQDNPIKGEVAYKQFLQQFHVFCKGYPVLQNPLAYTLFGKKRQKKEEERWLKFWKRLDRLDKKRLHVQQDTIKFFPYMLQGMYQCPPFSISDIVCSKVEDRLRMIFYHIENTTNGKKREKIILEASLFTYCYQFLHLGKNKVPIAVKLECAKDEEGYLVFLLNIVFLETGFHRIIKFFFYDEHIGIECQEYPDIQVVLKQLLDTDKGNTRNFMNILPESIQQLFENKVNPKATVKMFDLLTKEEKQNSSLRKSESVL